MKNLLILFKNLLALPWLEWNEKIGELLTDHLYNFINFFEDYERYFNQSLPPPKMGSLIDLEGKF